MPITRSSPQHPQGTNQPCFSAITSSTRLIYSLLRCIGFAPVAQVQILPEGVRVSVEDSRSMQAHAFLEKNLFTTYNFTPPRRQSSSPAQEDVPLDELDNDEDDEDEDPTVSFGVSLSALLECLQIFGVTETKENRWGGGGRDGSVFSLSVRDGGPAAAFDQHFLRVQGTCRLLYPSEGEPLSLILEEGGLTTTCELTTYQADTHEDIPLARDALSMKVILRASWLHDAIQELDGVATDFLVITANMARPWFVLSSLGSVGSTSVEFSNDRSLLEVFNVQVPSQNRYRYHLIKHALKAMNLAGKVSMRSDTDGVLSMQFLIETEGMSSPSFIDFRFLPQRLNESSDEESEEEEGEEAEGEEDDE